MSHWVNEGWTEVNKTFLWKQNKHKKQPKRQKQRTHNKIPVLHKGK